MSEIIYGRNPVREALRAGRRKVGRIYVSARTRQLEWVDAAAASGIMVEVCDHERIAGVAESSDHQAVVAEADPYPYVVADSLFEETDSLILALDQVQDPHNLGACARVAECVGVSGIVIPERRSVEVTAAACSTSAGAVEHLHIAKVKNLADFLGGAKQKMAWVYGADAGASQSYVMPNYSGTVVIVLGSEGKGLRPRVASSCDQLISIPLEGQIRSLNVSIASAILLFEARRQRQVPLDRN